MLRNIIKYGGLALVIIGIILVMKNLFKTDSNWENNQKKNNSAITNSYYSATISLLDQETKSFIQGANLVVKDKNGNEISSWKTENGVHLVPNLQKGTYTIVEKDIPEGYKVEKEEVKFNIKNKDQDVVVYNTKLTEEEKKAYEAEQRAKNTSANEVAVDNTLSTKGAVATMVAIMSFICGIGLIIYSKKEI